MFFLKLITLVVSLREKTTLQGRFFYCKMNLSMIRDTKEFKGFVINYIKILEDLTHSDKYKERDAKFLSQLRTAERSFNFILDQFPQSHIEAMFGKERWRDLKHRRDRVASRVSRIIDAHQEIKSRYVAYCEFLKDTRRHSSSL